MAGAKSRRPENLGMTWWIPPLALEQAHVVVDGLRDHGGRLVARGREHLARDGSDEKQRRRRQSGREQRAGPEAPRPQRPRGCRPARGQPPLEGDGRRVLRRAPLEGAGELALHEVGMRAVGAAVEMSAQGGHETGREPAVLIVEELIAHIVAVHV